MKFKPPGLPSNHSPAKWKWWKKCFEDGLRINGTTEEADKLVFLRTFVGFDFFILLESSANVCRRTENVGQAVFEAHESALCPSSNAQCQSKGQRIHRTIFWDADASC